MSRAIKISEEAYEKLQVLAKEVDEPIADVATKLINNHLKHMAKRGRGVQARRQQQNAWLSNVRSCRKNVSESSRQQ